MEPIIEEIYIVHNEKSSIIQNFQDDLKYFSAPILDIYPSDNSITLQTEYYHLIKHQYLRINFMDYLKSISHYKILEMISRSGKKALVLEENVLFHVQFIEKLSILGKIPTDWKIIFLGYFGSFSDKEYVSAYNIYGNFAYLIKPDICPELLKSFKNNINDLLLMAQEKYICYALGEPLIIYQLNTSKVILLDKYYNTINIDGKFKWDVQLYRPRINVGLINKAEEVEKPHKNVQISTSDQKNEIKESVVHIDPTNKPIDDTISVISRENIGPMTDIKEEKIQSIPGNKNSLTFWMIVHDKILPKMFNNCIENLKNYANYILIINHVPDNKKFLNKIKKNNIHISHFWKIGYDDQYNIKLAKYYLKCFSKNEYNILIEWDISYMPIHDNLQKMIHDNNLLGRTDNFMLIAQGKKIYQKNEQWCLRLDLNNQIHIFNKNYKYQYIINDQSKLVINPCGYYTQILNGLDIFFERSEIPIIKDLVIN
jgi:hypothetical protein